MFGDQVSSIAIPLAAVLVLHASAADMGYLTALVWLPSLLFGLHAGAWVDRRGQRRVTMMAADLGRFALLASLPVSYALHVLTLGQLFGVAFGTGVLSVIFTVSDSALFVAVVPTDRYLEGNSLLYASRALSFVGGPSLGGLLVQLLSAPFAIVADALSFLGSAFFLHRIRPAEPPPDRGGKGSVTAGARFIAGSPIVRRRSSGVAIINFFNLMFSALYLLYAVRELRISAGLIGLVLGAAAIGGVLGAAVTKRIADGIGVGLAYVAGCALFTVPLLLVPLAGGPKLAILGDSVRRRVRVGIWRYGLGHQRGLDLCCSHPGRGAVAGIRCLPGGELRHPPSRRAARRRARHDDRPAARALDRRVWRRPRFPGAAAVATPRVPDASG